MRNRHRPGITPAWAGCLDEDGEVDLDREGHGGFDEPGVHVAIVAASKPAWAAAPKPRAGSGTTVAPSDLATSPDPSVEQLSTTIGRKPAGILSRIHGNAGASFRHGKITSTIMVETVLAIAGQALADEPYKPENSSSWWPRAIRPLPAEIFMTI